MLVQYNQQQQRTHMLVDKKNGYVLALLCEPIKSLGNGCIFSLRVHDQKILLRIGRLCGVLGITRQHSS